MLLLNCAALAGCGQPQAPPPEQQAPEVDVSKVEAGLVTDYEDFPGRAEAIYSIVVRARATGYLDKVNFTEGADVEQGEVLFEIDPRTYQAQLNSAEANLVQAQAHLDRLEADYRRAVNIFPKGGISREEFDKIAGDRAEAGAAVGVAKANRDLAELNLRFTKVKAPISGRISRRELDPGNMVKADDTPLTTLVSLDPVHATFDLDERTTLHLKELIRSGKIQWSTDRHLRMNCLTAPLLILAACAEYLWHERGLVAHAWPTGAGLPVYIGLSDEKGFPHRGTINFADNRVDPETGTWRLRGRFANPNLILTPGLFVRVRLPLGKPYQATLVAEQALANDQGQKVVYVVGEGDRIEFRHVKLGRLNEKGLRVITEGLKPGERVVVTGLQRVREKQPVKPNMVPMPVREEQESGVRNQESGVRNQESGVRNQESGVRSQESEKKAAPKKPGP
jgi:RND family efflux transporter MFP subunit